MVFAGSRVEAALLLTTAVAVNLVFFYGYFANPVIAYSLSTPLEYNGTIDFTADLPVTMTVTNRGSSPARVALTVRLFNLSLTGPGGVEASIEEGFTEISVSFDEPIRSSEADSFLITIEPSGESTHLVLIFSAMPQPTQNPVTSFYDSFAEYKPERPTALLLKRIEGGEYKRVRKR